MKNIHNCKLIIGYIFNNSHKDLSTINISVIDQNGMKILRVLQGNDCEGVSDLTEILLENGYKVTKVT